MKFAGVVVFALVAQSSTAAAECTGNHCNVTGAHASICNRGNAHDPNPNFQSTGYFRDNYCTASSSDAGSHYVCVDLPEAKTKAGKRYSPFWVVTGQARSDDDAAGFSWPKPGPWCICMWAYARMLQQHPDFKDLIQCDATNEWVIEDYSVSDPSQCKALNTVCSKCNVEANAVKPSLAAKCASARSKCGSASSTSDEW